MNALDQQLAERKRLEEEEQQRHEAFGESAEGEEGGSTGVHERKEGGST